jgi:hypothetical protein
LLGNRQVDWPVDDFNAATFNGKEHVLRLLSSSRYGGLQKLVDTPPLSRVCTRNVFGEIHVKSARVMMWCISKKLNSRAMAKLLDVLRDLITGGLLCWK